MIKIILIYLIYLINSNDYKVGTCFKNQGNLPKNGYRDFPQFDSYGLVLLRIRISK